MEDQDNIKLEPPELSTIHPTVQPLEVDIHTPMASWVSTSLSPAPHYLQKNLTCKNNACPPYILQRK
eukprot:15328119-Ditylum_brightwellii.AAC.1